MATPQTSNRIGITPAACMRRKRAELYAQGYQQTQLHIPASLHARLKSLKTQYKMRGLDNVVSALIRNAMANYSPEDLITPPPPADFDQIKKIAVHIPSDQHAYLEAIAHRNRGISLGVALETAAARVTNLTTPPVQFSLIEGGTL